jgi:hypothetical protein
MLNTSEDRSIASPKHKDLFLYAIKNAGLERVIQLMYSS